MAEIQQKDSGERKKGKQKKFSIRVDFTAYGGYEYVVDYFLYALHVHE